MKKPYTVQCAHAAYYGNIVTVEADTLDEALDKAIQEADGDADGWRSMDDAGPTFVVEVREGTHLHPLDRETPALPIPDRFTEQGEPPVVTLDRSRQAGRRPRGLRRQGSAALLRRGRHGHERAWGSVPFPGQPPPRRHPAPRRRRARRHRDRGPGPGPHPLPLTPASRRRPDGRHRPAPGGGSDPPCVPMRRGRPPSGRSGGGVGASPASPRPPFTYWRTRPMKLMTKKQREKLLANGADRDGDHVPVVKLFNPCRSRNVDRHGAGYRGSLNSVRTRGSRLRLS